MGSNFFELLLEHGSCAVKVESGGRFDTDLAPCQRGENHSLESRSGTWLEGDFRESSQRQRVKFQYFEVSHLSVARQAHLCSNAGTRVMAHQGSQRISRLSEFNAFAHQGFVTGFENGMPPATRRSLLRPLRNCQMVA